MKLIFASDSFKGSLSAPKICDLLERVAARHFPDAQIVSIPVADGGEGTVDALLRAIGGRRMQKFVNGPLFEMETAQWGMLDDGVTAVIEMAQTSGLPYVPASQRDPRKTTSLGLGQLIAEAIRHGARKLFIGIGGSATNDGGIGPSPERERPGAWERRWAECSMPRLKAASMRCSTPLVSIKSSLAPLL